MTLSVLKPNQQPFTSKGSNSYMNKWPVAQDVDNSATASSEEDVTSSDCSLDTPTRGARNVASNNKSKMCYKLGKNANAAMTALRLQLQSYLNIFGTLDFAKEQGAAIAKNALIQLLSGREMKKFLVSLAQVSMFDSDTLFRAMPGDLAAFSVLRQMRYCFVRTPTDLAYDLMGLAGCASYNFIKEEEAAVLLKVVLQLPKTTSKAPLRRFLEAQPVLNAVYGRSMKKLAVTCPHAIYPTSSYRESKGKIWQNEDCSRIEAQCDLCYRAKVRVITGILETSEELADYYYSHGRVVCILDKKLTPLYGAQLREYFESRGIQYNLLEYRVWEKDKHIGTVEKILDDLKSLGVSRNEPVLIVGGGVITDLGGFACALYHRNTPYIQLCTSIVSGIDAGPSPRTCCDGHGYKNIFGAYHPPIVTFTDRMFWKTLEPGLIRHGISEIIKMAAMVDIELFELLEKAGRRLVTSKFGTLCLEDVEFGKLCDRIIGLALKDYVKAEYENLWETHQLRPHAYGHTWSPGFELPAGLIHGHAIGVGMGLSTHMAYDEGFVTKEERDRVLRLFDELEISLYHPVIHRTELLWACQQKMIEKRGGNLCAPVPKTLGNPGYIQDMPRERLERLVKEYKEVCAPYPRNGVGIEPLLTDNNMEEFEDEPVSSEK